MLPVKQKNRPSGRFMPTLEIPREYCLPVSFSAGQDEQVRDTRVLEALRLRVEHELAKRHWSHANLAIQLGMKPRTLNTRMTLESDWKLSELVRLADLFFEGDLNRLVAPFNHEPKP